ncbi:hypothetical protein ACET91_20505, partial [Aeromonas caviae]
QAIGPLPTGVVEGRGQGVHREDRLSHPGRTDAVNPVLVNRYAERACNQAILAAMGSNDETLLAQRDKACAAVR